MARDGKGRLLDSLLSGAVGALVGAVGAFASGVQLRSYDESAAVQADTLIFYDDWDSAEMRELRRLARQKIESERDVPFAHWWRTATPQERSQLVRVLQFFDGVRARGYAGVIDLERLRQLMHAETRWWHSQLERMVQGDADPNMSSGIYEVDAAAYSAALAPEDRALLYNAWLGVRSLASDEAAQSYDPSQVAFDAAAIEPAESDEPAAAPASTVP